jgi:hypothetical protein
MAWAAVGGLLLLSTPAIAGAQSVVHAPAQPVGRIASLASGSIYGLVQDEKGAPVDGAMVSAVGVTTAVAVTDPGGRFELRTLSPGPYLVRAHLAGYVSSSPQIVEVRPSGRTSSAIALQRATAFGSYPVLAAGVGSAPAPDPSPVAPKGAVAAVGTSGDDRGEASGSDDDHGEIAWRIRHARRGILKDATLWRDLLADDRPTPETDTFGPGNFLGRAVGSPTRAATNFFATTPFSGQINLLTTQSFDIPQQLFSPDSPTRGVTYVRLHAPVGAQADWTARGALTQGDISSWIVAGSYTTRAPARHLYDIGMSYSTQRYSGGNPLALRDVTDGSRNAGAVYGFDTFEITPAVALTYGARYARYDYLDRQSLFSSRVELTMTPTDHFRVSTLLSRRALAPGAEEFLPPADTGIWLPPQRTFSSLEAGRPLSAERATHLEVGVERDVAGSTISMRAFRQRVGDQLVTLFGGQATAQLGHYFVGTAGDVNASGCRAGFRTAAARRLQGSVEYSLTNARLTPPDDLRYLILLVPSAIRPETERIHDVATTIETDVPETSTRILVLYRVSNAFARPSTGSSPAGGATRPGFDARFDVQVRQSLPFMDFGGAKWEMLLAVRNFFRETAIDQSVYDELLVVRPPKRVVGGLTLHF